MNAVERLLDRADEVVGLFDALFGPVSGVHNRSEAESLSGAVWPFAFHSGHAAVWRDAFGEPYRELLTAERLGLIERWGCEGAVYLAVERTIAEHAAKRIRHGQGCDLTPEAVAAYCDVLAHREDLLDAESWTALAANVAQESAAWGAAQSDVIRLARRVRAAVQSLWQLDPKPTARRKARHRKHRWRQPRATLLAAIEELRPLAKPTASEKQTGGKQKKRRDRKHGGGKPPTYPMTFVREVFTARKRDEKHAAKAGRPLPLISEWLSAYFTNVKKLPLSTLPSKDPKKPEEWSIRATRFWRAVNKRMRDAETNRH
jgi:hypothetical protein